MKNTLGITGLLALLMTAGAAMAAPADTPEARYRALMSQAAGALASGEPRRAALLYEQAGTQFGESVEAELGQVRAYLEGGDFRQAVAFANLVAGEHAESMAALALLAYIEDRGGQTERALARLRAARAAAPDDVALLGSMAEILIDRGAAAQAIAALDAWIARSPPQGDIYALRARAALANGDGEGALRWRARAAAAANMAAAGTASSWPAPHFQPMSIPVGAAAVAANGFVVDAGSRVVTLARAVAGAHGAIAVRNGLGQVRRARVEAVHDQAGLAVLRLEQPYDAAWSIRREQMAEPAAGRSCAVLAYPVAGSLDPTYPALGPGIVLRTGIGANGYAQITSALGAAGSPIFDPAGHLVGIALGNSPADQQGLGKGNFAIGTAALLGLLPAAAPSTATAPPPPAISSSDELYERMLPALVQVVATH